MINWHQECAIMAIAKKNTILIVQSGYKKQNNSKSKY